MAKQAGLPPASDEKVRALLAHHECPVPFHQVRTRFLGNIASPTMSAPIEVVKGLWGGELPTFDTMDDVNELLGALVMGLWNRLSRHQDRGNPFRLTLLAPEPTRESLFTTAKLRQEEVDGFAEGLFASENDIDLPQRADEGMTKLAELQVLFAAVADITSDPTKPASPEDLKATLEHVREMTRIAEREINAVVQSCKRARKHAPPRHH